MIRVPLIFSPVARARIRAKLADREAWTRWFKRSLHNWITWPRLLSLRTRTWFYGRRTRGRYRELSVPEVLNASKRDILFIFGSGPSVRQVTDSEIAYFQQHDRMGFNWFCENQRIPLNYYLIKEVSMNKSYFEGDAAWDADVRRYSELVERAVEPDGLLMVQKGWRSIDGNRLVGSGLLTTKRRLFRFYVQGRGVYAPPSESLAQGLVHGNTSLLECINFGYLSGWKRIVLAGVDLNNSQYFWARDIKHVPGGTPHLPHPTGDMLVYYLERWLPYFKKRGIRLDVYNPQSLLAKILPVFDRGVVPSSPSDPIGDPSDV